MASGGQEAEGGGVGASLRQSADIDPIAALCAQHGIPLIEDAAEALGAVYYGSQGLSDKGDQLLGAPSAQISDARPRRGSYQMEVMVVGSKN